MVHLAINEGDDNHDVVHWLNPVTDRSTPQPRPPAEPEQGGRPHSPPGPLRRDTPFLAQYLSTPKDSR